MKQPNWKVPLVLSATLAILGTFAYWLEYSHKPKKEKSDTALKKPIAFEDDVQIARVYVRGKPLTLNAKCLELAEKKCKPGSLSKWEVELTSQLNSQSKTEKYTGDSENMKSLINAIQNSVATETIDLAEDTPEKRKQLFTEYGLSEELRKSETTPMIEVELEGGKKLNSWFGQEHPIGDKTFVASSVDGKLNEEVVFLISNFFKTHFEHNATYFRDKSIFNFERSNVIEMVGKTPKGSFSGKKVEQAWTLNNMSMSYERVETLLSYISQLKAKDFTNSNSIPAGAKSVASYSFKLKENGKDPTSIELNLFEKTSAAKQAGATGEKSYYLKTSVRPDVLEVESFAYSQLNKSINDFRVVEILNPTLKTTLTVGKLSGTSFKEAFAYELKNGKWEGTPSKDSTPDGSKLQTLLDQISTSSIREFVSPIAAAKKKFEFELGDSKNAKLIQWEFFENAEKWYLKDRLNTRNEWYLLDDSLKTHLPTEPDSWKVKK